MQQLGQRGPSGRQRHMGCQTGDARDAHRRSHIARLRNSIAANKAAELGEDERNDLVLMREEEKIARDVYLRLYDRWGLPPFANISGSEQAHMDAILALLQHFGLPDPARGLEIGAFHDPKMQALYQSLIEQGLKSREEAVRVGLSIEELDIADLRAAAGRTSKPEILAVYAELERGSRNHLRAFHRWKLRFGPPLRAGAFKPEGFRRHRRIGT